MDISTTAPLAPDFASITPTQVVLPYRDQPYLRTSYGDPILGGYECTVVEDSMWEGQAGEGERLTTIIVRFPRSILSEVNTHRVFSRNSASSRARSMRATIADVMEHPHIPLFTRNKKGMSGEFVSATERQGATVAWLRARDLAVEATLHLLLGDLMPWDESVGPGSMAHRYDELLDLYYAEVYDSETPDPRALSVHKQDANRLLEPFLWHEAIITSSMWKNFLELRTDLGAAQPAIVALARLVEGALDGSQPRNTWLHLPFIDHALVPAPGTPFGDMRDLLMLSATESAQISYRDKSRAEKSTATTRLGERLLGMRHMSPFEHIAFAAGALAGTDIARPTHPSNLGSNWAQLRTLLEQA